jgi:hypothetical protein
MSIFFEFKKQKGENYLFTQSQYIPGYYYYNQPSIVRKRWQHPGDITTIQRFAATGSSPAYNPAANSLPLSDAVYSDASFVRLKTLSVAYLFPSKWIKSVHASEARIYFQAQNLFTITNYVGSDPENRNIYVLPPLNTVTGGFQITF